MARIDRRGIDRAGLLHLVGDEPVLLVEEENPELLDGLEGHLTAAIIDELGPAREDRLLGVDPVAAEAGGDGLDDLDMGDGGFAEALDLAQPRLAGVEDAREGAEFTQQGLGQRLGIAAGG